jgi:hypothetical protein
MFKWNMLRVRASFAVVIARRFRRLPPDLTIYLQRD